VKIVRYSLEERVVHWVAGLSYLYLLLSGLAFFLPLLYWLTIPLGGGETARAWHPWAGVIFSLAVAWMYRLWRRDMRATAADRAWKRTLRQYIRNEDESVAPAGRFNPGQKSLFWLMYWGGAALLVSGLALWFTEYIPWSLRVLRFAAILVHVTAALATIAGFIVHIYMGLAVVRGGWSAIVRGEVTEEWARAHHPLWTRK